MAARRFDDLADDALMALQAGCFSASDGFGWAKNTSGWVQLNPAVAWSC